MAEANSSYSDHNHVRMYANLIRTLETVCEEEKLAELFRTLRVSGQVRSLPLADDDDVRRMLTRVGIIPRGMDKPVAAKLLEEYVRDLSEAVARTPAQVSLVLRLYSAGMYGYIARPICGPSPRCRDCGISRDCDYHNEPPKRSPSQQRSPAKRVEREGPSALSDEEVVALMVGGPRAADEQFKLAARLIKRYGSLRKLAAVSYGELLGLRGVTAATALRLSVAGEYYNRIISERVSTGPSMRSGKDFYDIYYPMMRDVKKEVFYVVLLDQKNRIIREHRVSEGTLTASLVHPREVFGPAIRESAAAVAFIHNHPSGDCEPSPEDKTITKRLVKTANLIGIRVLDHIIIGEGSYTSFLDEGYLSA